MTPRYFCFLVKMPSLGIWYVADLIHYICISFTKFTVFKIGIFTILSLLLYVMVHTKISADFLLNI